MKEVTYEMWKENPTPREMLVWDDDFEEATKKFVVYMLPKGNVSFNVLAIDSNIPFAYAHCAEIEKIRLMTKQELSWWLRDGKHREWSYERINAYPYFDYPVSDADEPIDDHIVVRENGGKWVEPLISLLLD